MIFAFFAALAAVMVSLVLFHAAARPRQERIAIRVHDEDERPPHRRLPY